MTIEYQGRSLKVLSFAKAKIKSLFHIKSIKSTANGTVTVETESGGQLTYTRDEFEDLNKKVLSDTNVRVLPKKGK